MVTNDSNEHFFRDIYYLFIFYKLLIQLLYSFFSGDVLIPTDEVNRNYLRLCNRIEKILGNKSFENLLSLEWRPFENLRSFDPDAPGVDWEYGGQQLCGDFLSYVEDIFIKNGEKIYPLEEEDIQLLNNIQNYIKNYMNYKKSYEVKWFEKIKEEAKKMTGKEAQNSTGIKISPIKNGSRTESVPDIFKELYNKTILHPKIRKVSENHYTSKQYRSAILDAFIELETMVKDKVNYLEDERVKGLIGTKLFRKVFNSNAPILVWNSLETIEEIDEYEGYSHIFAGAMQGIRNPKAHKIFPQEPMRAIRLLSLANLLAEIVDLSEYVEPD